MHFISEIVSQNLEAQREQLLAEFESERSNHQRVLRDYDRLEQRYQNLQDEMEFEKLNPLPHKGPHGPDAEEFQRGFDGLLTASSSGWLILHWRLLFFDCYIFLLFDSAGQKHLLNHFTT